ncbi:unnamed protein product [Menidia menidia]|uniref:long-chain-fatty-acid--CoA ligase n=1 Tax=Menidia menidia TaxID=238744 RepID=A0A8S4AMY6_9TELE|nr:unnamed protein product [Menidia menidia]
MLCVCAGSVLAGLLALLVLQRACWPLLWPDLRHYLRLRGVQRTVRTRMGRGVRTLLDCFLLQARRSPHKAFLICGERSLSYRDVDRRSRQFAAALRARARLEPGHVVALLMSNEPDFVCAWLGLSRLGCQVAFLNTNLRAGPLLHCVRACAARVLLVGAGRSRAGPGAGAGRGAGRSRGSGPGSGGWIRGPGWVRGFRLEPHGPPDPEISGAGLNPPPQRVHRLGGWWWRGVLTGASFSRVGFGRVSLGAHARWGRDALLCADLVEPVVEALPGLRGAGTGLWVVAHSAPTEDFHTLLDKLEDPPADPPRPRGLSKAARVGHLKALGSMAFLDLCGATCEDVVYITLPLYHMSASLLGVGGCIHLDDPASVGSGSFRFIGTAFSWSVFGPGPQARPPPLHLILKNKGGNPLTAPPLVSPVGATCVLRRKFSARHFWKDCVRHDVTVVQYIGELCRYLLNQPPVSCLPPPGLTPDHPHITPPSQQGPLGLVLEERAHCVRLAAGSGLRSDVWRKFITRFGIRQVREGYGLTETSIGFLNYTDEVGPIGRASYFNKVEAGGDSQLLDVGIIWLQTLNTVEVSGLTGEAGLLVAPLTAGNQFLGYAGSSEQSEKKLLRDLFEDGDVYFNTGDLLLRDHRDFLWKGENVSTTEVSEALCLLDFIQEATVYGVSIPGNEGRAGMAALVLRAGVGLEGKSLYEHLGKTLPAYAWPRFIRIQVGDAALQAGELMGAGLTGAAACFQTALDVTETFKQRKGKLVQEGFDPQASQDPLYVLDVSQRDYRLLTTSLFQDITSGKISL